MRIACTQVSTNFSLRICFSSLMGCTYLVIQLNVNKVKIDPEQSSLSCWSAGLNVLKSVHTHIFPSCCHMDEWMALLLMLLITFPPPQACLYIRGRVLLGLLLALGDVAQRGGDDGHLRPHGRPRPGPHLPPGHRLGRILLRAAASSRDR